MLSLSIGVCIPAGKLIGILFFRGSKGILAKLILFRRNELIIHRTGAAVGIKDYLNCNPLSIQCYVGVVGSKVVRAYKLLVFKEFAAAVGLGIPARKDNCRRRSVLIYNYFIMHKLIRRQIFAPLIRGRNIQRLHISFAAVAVKFDPEFVRFKRCGLAGVHRASVRLGVLDPLGVEGHILSRSFWVDVDYLAIRKEIITPPAAVGHVVPADEPVAGSHKGVEAQVLGGARLEGLGFHAAGGCAVAVKADVDGVVEHCRFLGGLRRFPGRLFRCFPGLVSRGLLGLRGLAHALGGALGLGLAAVDAHAVFILVGHVDPLALRLAAEGADALLFAGGVAGGLLGHDELAPLVGRGDALRLLIAADRAGMLLRAGGKAGGLLDHDKVAELVSRGNDLDLLLAADGAGALLAAVLGAGGRLRHLEGSPGVTQGRNDLDLLLVADFTHTLPAAVLGAGGFLRHLELVPAVALGRDGLKVEALAAHVAPGVLLPAVAGAGGLLVVDMEDMVPLAAGAEFVALVQQDDAVLRDGLPVSLLPALLAGGELLHQLFDGKTVGLLRALLADGAGFPVLIGMGAVALLDQVLLILHGDKAVHSRGGDVIHAERRVADRAVGLIKAVVHAGGVLMIRRHLVHMRLRMGRQRDQGQAHQRHKHQCQYSYSVLFHGVKPRVLE